MKWLPWLRHAPVDYTDSCQAVEESLRSVEEARGRWHRVNAVVARAEQAHAEVRSQRERNHLAEIVHKALLGGKPP